MWYGLKISNRIQIKEVLLLVGEKSIVFLPKNLEIGFNYLEFFLILKRFFNKTEKKKAVFGIFLNENLRVERQRLKENFSDTFKEENLIEILSHQNEEAYYTKNTDFKEFLGLEIRWENPVDGWLDKEEEISGILKEIMVEKQKIIKDYKK